MGESKGMPLFSALASLRAAVIEVRSRAIEPINLPYFSGSTFRGAFGNSFRRVACSMSTRTRGSSCLLMYVCPYTYAFETSVPKELARKGRQLPRPFVLRPPRAGTREVAQGDVLEFEFVLIGRAIELTPYFVAAIERCGRFGIGKGRGRFELEEVRDLWSGDVLYRAGHGAVSNDVAWFTPLDVAKPGDKEIERVKLDFVTPTRLTTNGRYQSRYDAELAVRASMRRCGDLLRAHCSIEPEFDVKAVLELAKGLHTVYSRMEPMRWARYSARQNRKIDMTGMVGQVELAGELGPFMPLFRAVELVHLGKGTAFGMGRVEVKNTVKEN